MSESASGRERIVGQAIRTLLTLLLMAPALGAIAFVREFAVNVPFWDQWVVIPYFERYYSGNLTIADLFAQHNEHRMFFPRIIMVALAVATRYNTIAEMYATCLILFANAFVLFKGFSLGRRPLLHYLSFLPICYLALSLRPYETWLFGIEVQWALGVCAIWLSLIVLDRSRFSFSGLVIAAVAGTVASYSFADGLLIWPLGCLQMFLMSRIHGLPPPRFRQRLATWAAIGAAVYALYFHGYVKPGGSPSLLAALKDPSDAFLYFVAVLGTSLGPTLPLALMAGGIILTTIGIMIVVMARRDLTLRSAIPVTMIVFGLASAALLAVGRTGFGLGQAVTPRYGLLTIYAVIGLYGLTVTADFNSGKLRAMLMGGIISGMVLGLVIATQDSLAAGRSWHIDHLALAYLVKNYPLESDQQMSRLFPEASVVRNGAQFLASRNLSVFDGEYGPSPTSLAELGGQTDYSIDTINGQPVQNQPTEVDVQRDKVDSIVITGYAVDRARRQPAGAVYARVDGKFLIPTLYGIARPDVATAFHIVDYQLTGFWCAFATSLLPSGKHTLVIDIVTADSRGYFESDREVTLNIR